MSAGAALGAGEWIREDLRKPFVIGQFMYVNGVRARQHPGAHGRDPFALEALRQTGVLPVARWTRASSLPGRAGAGPADGQVLFNLLCRPCHTVNGFLAIRPLVAGRSARTLEQVLANLDTWRGRRMPPFAGSDAERHALATWLATLGGGVVSAEGRPASEGRRYVEEHCFGCHGPGADVPIGGRGRTPAALYDMLGRLPQISVMMPAFEGSDDLRHAVAVSLASMPADRPPTEGAR